MPSKSISDGQRLRQWRIAHGANQKQAAERLGITRHYLCAVEAGKRKPSKRLMLLMELIPPVTLRSPG